MSKVDFFRTPVGVFQGFSNSGLEFHADLMLPYRAEFQALPMHGSFLLIELENEDEAVLGRISSLQSMGRLSGSAGSEYAIRSMNRGSAIPEDLKEDHLRYKVDIRVLGVLRKVNGSVTFAPSHRRLPHVGSRVSFPEETVLKEISCDLPGYGAPIGHLALGEFVFAQGDSGRTRLEQWHRVVGPAVTPNFEIGNMVSRRTFIFARAGYGKSNLTKLLFSQLYGQETPPTVALGGKQVPVGTLVFDPEGEYFWPDVNGRPGLADVPALRERLMVFTDRETKSKYYEGFRVGPARVDLSRMSPREAVSMGLYNEHQEEAKWATRVASLDQLHWSRTIELLDEDGHSTDLDTLAETMGLRTAKKGEGWELSEAQLNAARRDLVLLIDRFHAARLVTLEAIMKGLRRGMLVVFDTSQLPAFVAERLSRNILRSLFRANQEAFTQPDAVPAPIIVVIEEAQTVLGGTTLDDTDPIVSWVKEGRKYNLGAVLVTQQPGSISEAILSQGDNWFAFHLLSGGDLGNLKKANGHFSDDILQSLLNEPIKGQGVFWSSEAPRSYPIPIRVFPFESLHQLADREGTKTEGLPETPAAIRNGLLEQIYGGQQVSNAVEAAIATAMLHLATDKGFEQRLRNGKVHRNELAKVLEALLPKGVFPSEKDAFVACRAAIPEYMGRYGPEGKAWCAEQGEHNGKKTTFYRLLV